jgi:hypothetical protein
MIAVCKAIGVATFPGISRDVPISMLSQVLRFENVLNNEEEFPTIGKSGL